MQKNIYLRAGLSALVLALLSMSLPAQPVLAAQMENDHIPAELQKVSQPVLPDCPATTVTAFTNSTPIAIPTGPGTVTSTITVSGVDPYLWDLNLQTSIQHTFAADLDITIQSPAGTVVTLTTDNGAGNDNVFDGTLWNDSANDPVTDHIYTNMALASPLSPEEPLAAFIGEDPNGDWVLTIADDDAGDGGPLNSWALSLSTSSGCPTPLNVNLTQPSAHASLTSLQKILVSFNQDVISDGTAKAANHNANYLLVEAGKNGKVDTVTCVDGLVTDDVEWTLASVVYDSSNFTSTLSFTTPLKKGRYQLFICGTTSIWSVAGRKLNDGVNDTVVDFTIQPSASTTSTTTLPASGFAPEMVTALPIQPAEKAYLKSELTLEIPKIGVASEIMGIPQINDTWDVSWLGGQAGWLEGSAFPTWAGNSVLTGHATNANGGDGPFANLGSLNWGDQIVIHAFGQAYIYEVRTINRWTDPKDVGVLTKHEDLPWVTLITCNGYDEKTGAYRWRTVVRAVQVKVVDEE